MSIDRSSEALPSSVCGGGKAAGIAAGALALAALSSSVAVPAAEPDAARRAELRYLLEQDCGSCHGMTLKGGLGPPLTRQALQGKPPEFLLNVILHGRSGTAMPPWGRFLSRDEAAWLVEQLQAGRFGGE